MLENPDWNYDVIPELFNGKNIIDFVDPDIEEKLAQLEAEEDQMLADLNNEIMDEPLPEEYQEALVDIKHGRENARVSSVLRRNNRVGSKYKSLEGLKAKLEQNNLDTSKVSERFGGDRGKSKPKNMRKLLGFKDGSGMDTEETNAGSKNKIRNELADDEEEDGALRKRHKSIMRDISRNRSISTKPEMTVVEKVKFFYHSLLTRSSEGMIRD